MRIKEIRHNGNVQKNILEVRTSKFDLLLSYGTPVAVNFPFEFEVDGQKFSGAYKTDEFWSTTTSKHINRWYAGDREISQKILDDLLANIDYKEQK